MESYESPARTFSLQGFLQRIGKVGWLEKFWYGSDTEDEQGGDGVDINGSGGGPSHDDGFEMLNPTYAFGEIGHIVPVELVPSRAEAKARPLVDAALNIKDPWAGERLPSLPSSEA